MSWSNEFVLHWHEFLGNIEKYIRKETTIEDYISSVGVNSLIQTELVNWHSPQHSHGQWLRRLIQAQPKQGQTFQTALNQAHMQTSLAFEPMPFSIRLLLASLIAVINVAWRYRFKATRQQQIFDIGAWLALFFVLHQWLWPYYRNHQVGILLDQVRRELGQTEQNLHAILAKMEPHN
jgi:hypothetical protein